MHANLEPASFNNIHPVNNLTMTKLLWLIDDLFLAIKIKPSNQQMFIKKYDP